MARARNIQSAKAVFASNSDEINLLYAEHVPQYLADLKQAAMAADGEAISFHSHRMASAMKTIGFTEPARILEQIEQGDYTEQTLPLLVAEIDLIISDSLALLNAR